MVIYQKKSDGNLAEPISKVYPKFYRFMVIFMPWYSLRLKRSPQK